MCLILLAVQHHPDYPLVVAANRDEFYKRPTRSACFWPEHPQLFAGRDLQAGGTWMGITNTGRFAAITNYRDLAPKPQQAASRGELCLNFLNTNTNAEHYLAQVDRQKNHYAGFNLLVGDARQLFYYSNRQGEIIKVPPGIHGLSNGLLNEPWPKVDSGKNALRDALEQDPAPSALQAILLDRQPAEDSLLPDTGIGIEAERLYSSRFIYSEHYGTRCTTVLRVSHNKCVNWLEQCFDNTGASSAVNDQTFSIT